MDTKSANNEMFRLLRLEWLTNAQLRILVVLASDELTDRGEKVNP